MKCALKLIAEWLEEEPTRQAVVLLGNHEIEDWYFASARERSKVKAVVSSYRKNPRMYFPRHPFRSYELDNAVKVVAFFGDFLRTFRLAHAVTKEFVTSLYMGLDAGQLNAAKAQILTTLGGTWLELQEIEFNMVRQRWNDFLYTSHGSSERQQIIRLIYDHLRSEMSVDRILLKLRNSDHPIRKDAAGYLLQQSLVEEGNKIGLEAAAAFWGAINIMEAEFTGLQFAVDLRRLYSSLGVGPMYSLCGHFHADLGMFECSRDFGTQMIAVGGFQPRKLIGTEFAAYILSCNEREDILYRLSAPDDASVDESEWDLSLR